MYSKLAAIGFHNMLNKDTLVSSHVHEQNELTKLRMCIHSILLLYRVVT